MEETPQPKEISGTSKWPGKPSTKVYLFMFSYEILNGVRDVHSIAH